MKRLLTAILLFAFVPATAAEPISIWPDLAPGETSRSTGELMAKVAGEDPPATRYTNVRRPTMEVFAAKNPNGTAMLILPGGGFQKVVTDKEGSEVAEWLNRHGITAFVLKYRTKRDAEDKGWSSALQDAQRAMVWIRYHGAQWKLDKDRIGIMGFSAGGQTAARLICDGGGKRAYEPVDEIDETSHRANFAILLYPWDLYDPQTDALRDAYNVTKDCPPTFLAHTHDDRITSLSSALFYAALRKLNINSELHIYSSGGHGYGLRPVKGSQISTWPDHAGHWLQKIGMARGE